MNSKQWKKAVDDARRRAGSKYGFRQNSYISFKTENGYFFCLYFDTDNVRLTVKPLYADELWWRIINAPECFSKPVSFRGLGQYTVPGMSLASFYFPAPQNGSDISDVSNSFDNLFCSASAAVAGFLGANPVADMFVPATADLTSDPEELLSIITLLHCGRLEDTVAIIESAPGGRSGESIAYKYIRRWIYRDRPMQKIKTFFRRLIFTPTLPRPTSKRAKAQESQPVFSTGPWFTRIRPGIYIWTFIIMTLLLSVYFSDLHSRTIYEMTSRAWIVIILFAVACVLLLALVGRLIRKRDGSKNLFSAQMFLCFYPLLFAIPFVFIALFDGTNRLFADRDVNVAIAVVTGEKYKYKSLLSRGHTTYSYYTVVRLLDEDRTIKIEGHSLFELPPDCKIKINYRKGLFGFDIIDNIYYHPRQIEPTP